MSIYEFDDFRLDLLACELLSNGVRVEIPPRALDALAYLLRNRERPVSHDELRDKVWNVAALSPSSVPTCIAAIRKALKDDPDAPKIIETLRGRGYRFVATTHQVFAPPENDEYGAGFVGRASEAAVLSSEFDLAASSTPRLVILSGAAGIGKTHLVEAFSHLVERNADVVLVSTPETAGAPPLWPWIQALRALKWKRGSLLAAHPEVAGLLQPPTATRKNQEPYGPVSGSEERFRLFDSVTRYLERGTDDSPVVLIFDDFHRTDRASLNLLRHVYQEIGRVPILTIATVRNHPTNPDVDSSLAALARLAGTRTLQLPPLKKAETANLLSQRFGKPVTDDVVTALQERSGGNPLLLTRLIDAMGANSSFNSLPDILPHSVSEAILTLTGTMEASVIRSLAMAAVLGRDFSLRDVSGALGCPETDVQDHLSAAQSRGIIAVRDGTPKCYRFVHLLFRDTLYEHLAPRERAEAHYRVATTLERAHHDRDNSRPALLAHHYLQAAHIGAARKAFDYSVLAAEEAVARIALEDAPTHYRNALGAASLCVEIDDAERCQLLVKLGESEMNSGARPNARASLVQAARLARKIGASDLFARAALSLAPGALAIEVGVYDPTLVRLLETALTFHTNSSLELRARLLSRLSLALAWAGRENRRRDYAQEALQIARNLREPATLAMALIAQHSVLGGPENLQKRIELTDELREVALQSGVSDLVLMHRLLYVTDLLELGKVGPLDREIELYQLDAAETRLPHFLWYAELFRAMRSLMTGRFAEAAASAEQFHAMGMRVDDKNAAHSFGVHCAYQLWETGRAAKAAELGATFARGFASVPAWDAAVAVFEYDAGWKDGARARFSRLSEEFANLPRNQVWTATAAFLSEGCARLESRDRAREIYDALLPGNGQIAVVGFAVASLGPIARYLGMLARTFGDPDTAIAHLHEAIQQDSSLGGIPSLLRSKYEMAKALCARDADADGEMAKRLARQVREGAERHGMRAVYESARDLAR